MNELNPTEILLAEDNPQDLQLTLRAFDKAQLGCRIHIARDGEEVLAHLFRPEGATPRLRLILLDLKLPKIDGIQLLRQIKQDTRTQPIPVVILSSSAEQSDIRNCYQLGANSYVVKPMNFEQFAQAVRALGHYWMQHNQPLAHS
jgi:CheY-like chemotaxis protein